MVDDRVDDQPAFILHRRDYGNSSLILELLTADHGRVGLLAKGARKRRAVGDFQPGNRLSVGWRGRGELKTLCAIESRRLPIPPDCYLPLFYVNELLMALTPRFEPVAGLFARYQGLLLSLDGEGVQAALRGFEMDLMTGLGLMPSLDRDLQGETLESAAPYRLRPDAGLQRVAERDGVSASGELWLGLAARRFGDPAVLRLAQRALRQIIDSNLGGRPLQSRALYQQMTRNKR